MNYFKTNKFEARNATGVETRELNSANNDQDQIKIKNSYSLNTLNKHENISNNQFDQNYTKIDKNKFEKIVS